MKSLTQSRTLWVNLLVIMIAAVTGIMGTDIIVENPALMAYFVAGVGVMNVILRVLTKIPVSLFSK